MDSLRTMSGTAPGTDDGPSASTPITDPPRRPSEEYVMPESMIERSAEGAAAPASRAWWGDRSVKTKVLATVTVSAAVAGVIGFMGLVALDDAAASAHELYQSNLIGAVS